MTGLTRPIGEQLRFLSSHTGDHILDDYLENAEIGGRQLADLLAEIFDDKGDPRSTLVQLRVDPDTRALEMRIGTFLDPEAGWADTGIKIPSLAGGETLYLDSLADVDAEAAKAGDTLRYDGDSWRPGRQDPRVVTQPYSATPTVDWSAADTVSMTLEGNATITFTGAKPGQKCILVLTQDEVGGRTVTIPEARFSTDLPTISLSTAAGKSDKLGFIYDADAEKYDYVAVVRGF